MCVCLYLSIMYLLNFPLAIVISKNGSRERVLLNLNKIWSFMFFSGENSELASYHLKSFATLSALGTTIFRAWSLLCPTLWMSYCYFNNCQSQFRLLTEMKKKPSFGTCRLVLQPLKECVVQLNCGLRLSQWSLGKASYKGVLVRLFLNMLDNYLSILYSQFSFYCLISLKLITEDLAVCSALALKENISSFDCT